MNCQNIFCIYRQDGVCTLKEVSLNIMGMCDDCILIDPNAETLKAEKQKILDRHKTDYLRWDL